MIIIIYKNGIVLLEDFEFSRVDIRIEEGKIAEIGTNLSGKDEIEIDGLYFLPGLIEEHFHGANGYAVRGASAGDFLKISEYEATKGVTTIIPSLISCSEQEVYSCIESVKNAISSQNGGSRILGLHLEGPYLNEKYRGAHDSLHLRTPSIESLSSFLNAAKGCVKLLTIAPELEGAIEVIKYAVEQGIAVEIGHSEATYEQSIAAIEAGATLSTHTFNAMAPLNHRNPGILGAVLTDNRVHCEVIADLGHVAGAVVKLVYRAKGVDKVNIVSDSTGFAGYPDGEYSEQNTKYTVKNGIAYLENGTIIGSTGTIFEGVKNCVTKLGIPLEHAVKMASHNPAVSLKIYDETGSINKGKRADFFLMDRDFNIRETYCGGKKIY